MLEKTLNYINNTGKFVILSLGSLLSLDQFSTYSSINCSQSVLEVGLWVK